MARDLEVTVLNRQRSHEVSRRALTTFLERLASTLDPGEVDTVAVCLVADRRMRELNRTFRGRDVTTDVLSFPAEPVPGPPTERHLGDIVISVPAAARQASEADHPLETELEHLTLHGYLHLLGYDHETDDGTMRRLERELAGRLIQRTAGR